MLERLSASPGMARATMASVSSLDVTRLLPTVEVPTLVVHATDDLVPFGWGQLLADKIPGRAAGRARGGRPPRLERRLRHDARRDRGVPHRRAPRAPSPTACSRPCCSPTSSARPSAPRELGDRRWRDLLDRHDAVRPPRARALPRPRGQDDRRRLPRDLRRPGAGDPRARARSREAGRARARDPAGHAHRRVRADAATTSAGSPSTSRARVAALAGPGEVLVSSTVKRPRRRLGHRVRRPRPTSSRASRRVAALGGCA